MARGIVDVQLWTYNCGRTIEIPMENLYKTYRVCGNHFDSTMFLNDLKNRLQPHAIPKEIHLERNTIENDLSMTHDSVLICTDHISFSCNDQDANMDQNRQKDQEVQCRQPLVIKDKKIQTNRIICTNSPRKKKLKKKIYALQKQLQKMKKQLMQQKGNCTKDIKKLSVLEYCDVTDQILPPSIASFVKVQVHLTQQSPKVADYEKMLS
ncbi:uncharacterized protein LOC116846840 [Odontomachus brunneus]|uniref:uncharacterized protein LOC116846840 n=1 Tax=Odontomachus brunneus TaxID=486640 RepID=UPI0013F1C98C|nr:uncharacterized protein LOC116846840 [Odontomachus brunneus]